jgi:hypothetical protein
MVLPLVMAGTAAPHHHMMMHSAAGAWSAAQATMIHSAGYLLVSAVLAVVVFEKLGVGLLRKAWFNLDLVWAVALVVTSIVTLVMAA